MTLVEFLAVVKAAKRETIALSVLYWYERYGNKQSMTAAEVKSGVVSARITNAKNINMADVLGKAGASVDVVGNAANGSKLWQLTETGRKAVRATHGLPENEPELEQSVGDLEKIVAKVTEPGAKKFLEEAVLCLRVDARRAAVVFVWVGAAADLKQRIWSHGASAVTTAFQKYLPKLASRLTTTCSSSRKSTSSKLLRISAFSTRLSTRSSVRRSTSGTSAATRTSTGRASRR